MSRLILSVYFGYHDSCVTFATRDKVLLHLEAERIFRRKNARASKSEMDLLVSIGLQHLNADISDVDELLLASWFSFYDQKNTRILGRKFDPTITDHHRNHVGCTLPSGFADYICVVADGGSEDGTTKIYHRHSDGTLQLLADHDEDIVTGKFFGTLTQLVVDRSHNLAHQQYPGKLMGLAPLGSWSEELADLLHLHASEVNRLHVTSCEDLLKVFGLSDDYTDYWLQLRRRDLAFTGQKVWIDRFLEVLEPYSSISKNIALTGGCAMNVALCQALRNKEWFENVYVSPVSNDSGQSLGAILYKYPTALCKYPFLGRSFGQIQAFDPSQVVKDLVEEKIVAWYQGAAEIGPRALGHRSFLALATSVKLRDRLSMGLKRREPFRPVSPVVPVALADEWFDVMNPSPFMGFSPQVRKHAANCIPAVMHIDGSSRVQTVDSESNAELHTILLELQRHGLPPVLMNTSLNLPGEPIVDTPQDAQRALSLMGPDALYINGVRYAK